MVSSGKRRGQPGRKGVGELQRPDPDGRRRHLRNRAEKSVLAQLPARPLQREAGKRCARIPPHVRRGDVDLSADCAASQSLEAYSLRSHRSLTLLAVIFVASLAPAQTPDPVDTYVQAEMQKRHIPGLALLVIRDGKAIKQQG